MKTGGGDTSGVVAKEPLILNTAILWCIFGGMFSLVSLDWRLARLAPVR